MRFQLSGPSLHCRLLALIRPSEEEEPVKKQKEENVLLKGSGLNEEGDGLLTSLAQVSN